MFRIGDLTFKSYSLCRILRSGTIQIVTDAKIATHYFVNGNIYDIATTQIEYVPDDPIDDEATAEDYEAALAEVGV